ncbi:MAG TPA: hemerythrin domain-containing protein [Bradyrhizobium sp.]|jgi:hemerythrin-like domain-containing protein|nr:hemerythrin domain-containing protein [Bradyrhizobium sp.]
MPKIIDLLLEEHQNIERLLLVLEHELEIFDRSGRPDYEILQTIIQYFQDYPERCHHPKEEMIFEKLKARDAVAAKRFGDVEAEHEVETRRLRSFARAVDSVLADQEFLRESFHLAVNDFIEHQRQHLRKEERLLFPAAIKALRREDWAEIDARLDNRKDPLFDGVVEEKFNALRKTILRWEQETEEARAALTRIQP